MSDFDKLYLEFGVSLVGLGLIRLGLIGLGLIGLVGYGFVGLGIDEPGLDGPKNIPLLNYSGSRSSFTSLMVVPNLQYNATVCNTMIYLGVRRKEMEASVEYPEENRSINCHHQCGWATTY